MYRLVNSRNIDDNTNRTSRPLGLSTISNNNVINNNNENNNINNNNGNFRNFLYINNSK